MKNDQIHQKLFLQRLDPISYNITDDGYNFVGFFLYFYSTIQQ